MSSLAAIRGENNLFIEKLKGLTKSPKASAKYHVIFEGCDTLYRYPALHCNISGYSIVQVMIYCDKSVNIAESWYLQLC